MWGEDRGGDNGWHVASEVGFFGVRGSPCGQPRGVEVPDLRASERVTGSARIHT